MDHYPHSGPLRPVELKPHPIDELISPELRRRFHELDPMLNLDRLAVLVRRRQAQRSAS